MEKFIVAQQYTTKMGVQGWTVGITGEYKFRMFLRTAKKAMGYMFILKNQTGLNISDNCLQRLSFAHKEEKSIKEKMERAELVEKAMEMRDAKIDEEMKKEAAKQRKEEKEAKKQRRTKKNSK